MKQNQKTRRANMLFTLAALVVVLMSNVYVGRAIEPDPRILWVADSSIGIIHGFAVHPNGNVFAYRNNSIFEIDGKTGKVIKGYPIFTDSLKTQKINTLVFSDDGRFMAVEGIYLYDFQEGKISKININNSSFVFNFLPNSHKIVISLGPTQNERHSILSYNIDNNQIKQSSDTEEMITNISFSPDGKYMATAGTKEKSNGNYYTVFKLWDAQKLTLIHELKRFDDENDNVRKIQFTPDGKKLVFHFLGYVELYSSETKTFIKRFTRDIFNDEISTFEILSNENLLLVSKVLKIINLDDNNSKDIFDFQTYLGKFEMNKTKDILFAYTPLNSIYRPITALDLDKLLTNIEEKITTDFIVHYDNFVLKIIGLETTNINYQIEIFDIQGNLIKKLDVPSDDSEISIPLKLPIGTYLINITSANKKFSSKFIVTK